MAEAGRLPPLLLLPLLRGAVRCAERMYVCSRSLAEELKGDACARPAAAAARAADRPTRA